MKNQEQAANRFGLVPGSVVYTGAPTDAPVSLTAMTYDATSLEEYEVDSFALDGVDGGPERVTWLNIDGVHDTELVSRVGSAFGLHPITLENISHVGARPQISDYDEVIFASLRMLSVDDEGSVTSEQVSLFVGRAWVVTFQERPGDVFSEVRERLRSGRGRIRERGSDYLWYALIDAIVDHYMIVMDRLSDLAETLEETVWDAEDSEDITEAVQELRWEARTVRRAVRPIREEIESLILAEHPLIEDATVPFFSDLKDHLLQLADAQDGIRDSLSTIMDVHFALLSARMNEVMKVLTIMASIFIPITFVAGVYGMNFERMPELGVAWAYPFVWLVMVSIAIGMLVYFRRKKWL